MPAWLTTSIGDEPEVVLQDWTVIEAPDGSWFVAGRIQNSRESRVFGPVAEFDLTTMRGRTDTARVFEITGQSGATECVKEHWDFFCELKNISYWTEISDAVVASDRLAEAA